MTKRQIKLLVLITLAFFLMTGVKQSTAVSSGSIDQEIESLNLKIQNQKKQISSLKSRQEELQTEIAKKRNDSISLQNQLAILEDSLAESQLDIDGTNLEIDKTNLEIKKIEIDSNNLNKDIETQKDHITNLLRLIYEQDQVSTLEALLLNNSLAEFLNQIKYLEDANEKIGEEVEELKQQKNQLEDNRVILSEKNEELTTLRNKLEERKSALAYEQKNKSYILDETKSSEQAYQNLLQQAKREQAQAEADIVSAERLVRQKMSEKEQAMLDSGDSTIFWPVPKNYIVSIFHDPDYPYRRIIGEHSAIDIRAAQGTTLKAAADGYVARVKFNKNSSDYAYIMIIHNDGLATVYGHVSAVYVESDQYVHRGQVIGKTGGTPGTAGSGRFSTGPHLHFEVRKDGLPVNPEKYLP